MVLRCCQRCIGRRRRRRGCIAASRRWRCRRVAGPWRGRTARRQPRLGSKSADLAVGAGGSAYLVVFGRCADQHAVMAQQWAEPSHETLGGLQCLPRRDGYRHSAMEHEAQKQDRNSRLVWAVISTGSPRLRSRRRSGDACRARDEVLIADYLGILASDRQRAVRASRDLLPGDGW